MPKPAVGTAVLLLSLLLLSPLVLSPLATPAQAAIDRSPMLSERVKKISRVAMSKWTNVLRRSWATQPLADRACARRVGRDCRLGQWQAFIGGSQALRPREQIRQVHGYVNRFGYREDQDTWGKSDYWAAPGEFFARGGDCEDYAIAKYLSLKQLGFDPENMRILVLRDTRRRLMHAVLLVQHGGETLVLDNNAHRVLTWDEVPHYAPLYSVNEIDFWLHRSA